MTDDINPDAVWDDGSPITFADFQCTMRRHLNTPGSLTTVGYDKIMSIEQGDDRQAGRRQASPRCTPRTRTCSRGLIKADAVDDCNDVSADFADNIPFSATAVQDRLVEPRPAGPVPERGVTAATTKADSVARSSWSPRPTDDTEIASLVSGESDFIFPQAYAGITDALNDPNIKSTPGYGTNYEGLYFQQGVDCTPDESRSCAFKDADFRHAFPSRSTATSS